MGIEWDVGVTVNVYDLVMFCLYWGLYITASFTQLVCN